MNTARSTRTVRSVTPARSVHWDGIEALEARDALSFTPIYNTPAYYGTTASAAAVFADALPVVSGGTASVQSAITDSLIGLNTFRSDPLFAGIDGRGYSTVILDTGAALNHPFFGPDADHNGIADRIVYQYDFADGDANASDVNGHGSNVTSIIASQDGTYTGMAPGVNIIDLKVFKNSGAGSFAYVEQALQWVVRNATNYNIVSVNMSLGDSGNYSTPQQLYGISDELAALASLGVTVVAAAGNSYTQFGTQGLSYPAADPNVLAVGAVYDQSFGGVSYASGARAYTTGPDRITPFSQRTTSMWEVFAPGAPITGAGLNGGLITEHGTSQASPHVAGVVALAQELAERVLGRRLSLQELRGLMVSTATAITDGDDENDNAPHTGQVYKRLNVEALGQAIQGMAPSNGPHAVISMGTKPVGSGTGLVAFGSAQTGAPVVKMLTVRNTGTQDLSLSELSAPAGFSIASGVGSATRAPGATTTFAIRFDAGTVGQFSGNVTLSTNDADQPTYTFGVSGTGVGYSAVVDDGDAGFATAGSWTVNKTGFQNDSRSKVKGKGAASATWTFKNIDPGQYRVSVTWRPASSLADNAPFSVLDGSSPVGAAPMNLRIAPHDRTVSGGAWADVGTFSISGTRLVVRLSDESDGPVIADAVRIERVDNLSGGPAVLVKVGSTPVAAGGAYGFGSSASGAPVSRTFTVRNVGDAPLTLGSIDLPAGFVLASGFDRPVVAPGSSTTFSVRTESGAAGTYSGAIAFATNDQAGSFSVKASATVTPVIRYLDDGDKTFKKVGSWTVRPSGYLKDSLYKGPGMGAASATWGFTGLTPGRYRVSATWIAAANLAVDARGVGSAGDRVGG